MNLLLNNPFARILVPFIIGILLASYYRFSDFFVVILMVVLCLLCIHMGIEIRKARFRPAIYFGLSVNLFFLVLGGLVSSVTGTHDRIFQKSRATPGGISLAMVRQKPLLKSKSIRVEVAVLQCYSKGEWNIVRSNCLLYFKNDDSLVMNLEYGDCILLNVPFARPLPPTNPYQFNYARYLLLHDIHFVAFVDKNERYFLHQNKGKWLRKLAADVKGRFEKILTVYGMPSEEFNIAMALLMGDKGGLDEEVRNNFSQAGAMHVLCVSGLHVGIIFMVANTLLFFLSGNKMKRWMKSGIIMILIWSFALITGFSPSVIRASAMFSMILVAGLITRTYSIYNIIFASAFIMLMMNPENLFLIGFQLSYAAVIGIVSLYALFERIWKPKLWLTAKMMGIVYVSLAATLATLPLTLYYFHQFPVYFILTNIVVIPTTFLIIYLSLATMVIASIPIIGETTLSGLEFLLKIFVSSVETITSFPFSTITNINIDIISVTLFYVSLLVCYAVFIKPSASRIKWIQALIIVIIAHGIAKDYYRLRFTYLTVYDIKGKTAIEVVNKNKCMFVYSPDLNNNDIKWNIQENRIRMQLVRPFCVNNIESINIVNKTLALTVSGKKIIIAGYNMPYFLDGNLYSAADILIFTRSVTQNFDQILSTYKPQMIILNNSEVGQTINDYNEIPLIDGIQLHNIKTDGAFKMSW